MTEHLGALTIQPRTGAEPFHRGGASLGFDVASFWRWSASDLISNVYRGVLAEYLVARALGIAPVVRVEWDACDLRTDDGVRVEVKSAAYLQSWRQPSLSRIKFRIGRTKGWEAATNTSSPVPCRAADVYIFAVLVHKEKATLDPLDVTQWEFYVVPTSLIEETFGSQKEVALSSLRRVAQESCRFDDLSSRFRELCDRLKGSSGAPERLSAE